MKKMLLIATAVAAFAFVGVTFAEARGEIKCQDSDSGFKAYYYIKGTATSISGDSVEDACVDKNTLRESLCGDGGNVDTVKHDCPNGCENGQCLEQPAISCTDSDSGFKAYYYIRGTTTSTSGDSTEDVCLNEVTLKESLCGKGGNSYSVKFDCPNGCENGQCLETPSAACTDSDSGFKAYYYIKGTATSTSGSGGSLEDVCLSDITLKEALCNKDGSVYAAKTDCPNGCRNGQCLEGPEQWSIQRKDALEKIIQQKNRLKAAKEKLAGEQCAKIQEKVQNKEVNFENAKEKHVSAYVNLSDRINKFVVRADASKLDTTAIKNHLSELQLKIDKFKEDYNAYIAKLKESKDLSCGHSEGEFKAALLESKTLLKIVHDDAADIRTYVRTTMLPDIKALKTITDNN